MIIKYDNKAIKYTNKWVSVEGITPPPVPTVYSVHTVSSTGGSVSAVPNSGISGTEVTLSNTPATNYTFSSYSVTGATLKNSNQFDIGSSDVYVKGNFTYSDPYNPLDLPANTMRLRFTDGYTPTAPSGSTYTQVSSSPNIWDLTREPQMTSWYGLFMYNQDLLEVLGANTSGVTNMEYLFYRCFNLTNVALFDVSDVITDYGYRPGDGTYGYHGFYCMFYECKSMTTIPLFDLSTLKSAEAMFYGCSSLTSIPLFDLSSAVNTSNMFSGCSNVETGALALYQQVSTQTNPPTTHPGMFACGYNTVTGAAERAQIPTSWGGTME